MNTFTIPQQLPTLNEYTLKCRAHWSRGAAFKADVENMLCLYINNAMRRGECVPATRPCSISIAWHEKTQRRDVDNIQSAQKFILDAMQKCGVIKTDGRKWVKQINHTIVDDDEDKVIVAIFEV